MAVTLELACPGWSNKPTRVLGKTHTHITIQLRDLCQPIAERDKSGVCLSEGRAQRSDTEGLFHSPGKLPHSFVSTARRNRDVCLCVSLKMRLVTSKTVVYVSGLAALKSQSAEFL